MSGDLQVESEYASEYLRTLITSRMMQIQRRHVCLKKVTLCDTLDTQKAGILLLLEAVIFVGNLYVNELALVRCLIFL